MAHRFLSYRNGTGSAQCSTDDGSRTVVAYFNGACPRLPGVQFVEIEYVPRVNARVLAADDPEHWRPMTPHECEVADETLYRMRDNALRPMF